MFAFFQFDLFGIFAVHSAFRPGRPLLRPRPSLFAKGPSLACCKAVYVESIAKKG